MSGKMKIVVYVIAIIVFLVLTLPLLFYAYLDFAFSGGYQGMRNRLKPAPDVNSPAIITCKNAIKGDIEDAFKVVDNKAGFTRYAVSTHDLCYEGEANWKIVDKYAHRCEFRVIRFYGFNGDFRVKMVDFDTLLGGSGWTHPYGSIQDVMTVYYDPNYGLLLPRRIDGRKYLVSDLPSPGSYYKKNLVLNVVYLEKETDELFRLSDIQNIYISPRVATYDDRKTQDAKALFEDITKSYKYVLAISIQGTYFEN
jgi:hypothetical protein